MLVSLLSYPPAPNIVWPVPGLVLKKNVEECVHGHGLTSRHINENTFHWNNSMKLLKCVLLLAGIFLCCGNMLVAFLGFFYHFLLDICIDRGDMGFLSIVLMSASRSCCPFSRFIHAWSPEQGRWVWEGGVRVSPSILSSEGWDKSWKWLSCLLWMLERWTASSHD